MPNIKYSQAEIDFVKDNILKLTTADFAKKFKTTNGNIKNLISKWRKDGHEIPYMSEREPKAKEGYKKLEFFNKNSRCTDGKSSKCKKCVREDTAAYRAENPDKVKVWKQKASESYRESKKNRPKMERVKRESPIFREKYRLNDESLMPEGHYKDCLMKNVPAWHLLDLYHTDRCGMYVKTYIIDNMEVLKMEAKK